MPYISIELSEIYDDLSKSEKKELVEWLKEDGYIVTPINGISSPNYTDNQFDEALAAMSGKRHMMTVEEEFLILNIAQKFIHAGK